MQLIGLKPTKRFSSPVSFSEKIEIYFNMQTKGKTLATTMKRFIIILLIGVSNITFAQIDTKVSGKIIDEKMTCLFGVKITNLRSGTESRTDQYGFYEIKAMLNDTLKFQMIGLTSDKIKIEEPTQTLNVIMINKEVNCLGANWTEKQYRKAYQLIEKRLKELYKKADDENVWKNSGC